MFVSIMVIVCAVIFKLRVKLTALCLSHSQLGDESSSRCPGSSTGVSDHFGSGGGWAITHAKPGHVPG